MRLNSPTDLVRSDPSVFASAGGLATWPFSEIFRKYSILSTYPQENHKLPVTAFQQGF